MTRCKVYKKVVRERGVEAAVSKFLEDVKRQHEISETEERASIVEIRQMDLKIQRRWKWLELTSKR